MSAPPGERVPLARTRRPQPPRSPGAHTQLAAWTRARRWWSPRREHRWDPLRRTGSLEAEHPGRAQAAAVRAGQARYPPRDQRPAQGLLARPGESRGLAGPATRSEEHTSELQSRGQLVCRLLLEKKKGHAT